MFFNNSVYKSFLALYVGQITLDDRTGQYSIKMVNKP